MGALGSAVLMVGPLLIDMARDLRVEPWQAGWQATVTAVPWALAAPFGGLLSDRFGRRPLVVFALGGAGFLSLLVPFAPGLGVLLGLRFLTGLCGAFGPVSVMAAAGDLFPPSRRGWAMGWVNFGINLSTILGVPLLAAVGGIFGWRWAFVGIGAVLIALSLLIQKSFPPPARTTSDLSPATSARLLVEVPAIRPVLVANLLERSFFNGMSLYFPVYLMLSYGLSAAQVAPSLIFVALGGVAGTILGSWLGDRYPRVRVFILAQLIAAIASLAAFGRADGLPMSVVLGIGVGLANAASRPAFLAVTTSLTARNRGAVMGLLSFSNQSGVALGSGLGGLVIGQAGFGAFAVALTLVAAGASLTALPLANLHKRTVLAGG